MEYIFYEKPTNSNVGVMQRSAMEVEPVKGLLCEARARLVLDSLDAKRAALELALETSETLADIGVIVKC